MVGLPAGQQGHRGRLGCPQVRQLQLKDEGVLGTELQVTVATRLDRRRSGGRSAGRGAGTTCGQWPWWLLLAMVLFVPLVSAQSPDDGFLAVLGELREAS